MKVRNIIFGVMISIGIVLLGGTLTMMTDNHLWIATLLMTIPMIGLYIFVFHQKYIGIGIFGSCILLGCLLGFGLLISHLH